MADGNQKEWRLAQIAADDCNPDDVALYARYRVNLLNFPPSHQPPSHAPFAAAIQEPGPDGHLTIKHNVPNPQAFLKENLSYVWLQTGVNLAEDILVGPFNFSSTPRSSAA